MQRYFFHVRDGEINEDAEGTPLPGVNAARSEAMHRLGGLLAEQPERFSNGHDWRMEVTDATGLLLFRIDLLTTDSPALAPETTQPRLPTRL